MHRINLKTSSQHLENILAPNIWNFFACNILIFLARNIWIFWLATFGELLKSRSALMLFYCCLACRSTIQKLCPFWSCTLLGKYAAPAPFPEEMRVTPNHKLSVSPPLRLSAMHKWCVGQCHGAQAPTIVSPCIFYQLGQLADWAGALRGLRGPIKWVQPAKPGQGVSRAGPWIFLLITIPDQDKTSNLSNMYL